MITRIQRRKKYAEKHPTKNKKLQICRLKRLQEIFEMRYNRLKSVDDISEKFGISVQRVQYILKKVEEEI